MPNSSIVRPSVMRPSITQKNTKLKKLDLSSRPGTMESETLIDLLRWIDSVKLSR